MTDYELGMILNSIETAEDEKELQAMTDALEKRKEQLTEENTAKEKRAMAISALFNELQNKAEQELEKLFDKFYFGTDSMYIKITAENMAECLTRLNYKVERPYKNENSLRGNFYFRLSEPNFYEMYLDNADDIIIPLEL